MSACPVDSGHLATAPQLRLCAQAQQVTFNATAEAEPLPFAALVYVSSLAMMSSLGRATCGRSGRPQLHSGYARRNIYALLGLHGHRLHDDRAVRASDQEVGTRSGTDRAARGRTRIGSRQRRPALCGRRKDGPSQLAAGRRADVEPKRAGCPHKPRAPYRSPMYRCSSVAAVPRQ